MLFVSCSGFLPPFVLANTPLVFGCVIVFSLADKQNRQANYRSSNAQSSVMSSNLANSYIPHSSEHVTSRFIVDIICQRIIISRFQAILWSTDCHLEGQTLAEINIPISNRSSCLQMFFSRYFI